MPRETESIYCRQGTLTQIHQRSRNWSKEEFEQSIDLRVDGIPNDETCKDEQYMHKITEQVQKLVKIEKSLKNDSHEDSILSEKAAKGNFWSRQLRFTWELCKELDKVQRQRCYS